MGWLYSPAQVASSLGSTSPSETPTVPWCMSSGKPTQRPLSWAGWRTRPWIKRLSGTTSVPSMVARGVESWISSLAASRARTSQPPAEAKGLSRGTDPGSGLSTAESLAKWDRESSSWRTSQLLLFGGSTSSLERLPISGSMRNGCVWVRETSVPPTSETGSSSWPTPMVQDNRHAGMSPSEAKRVQPYLAAIASQWPTPNAADGRTSPDWPHNGGNPTLPMAAVTKWETPKASELERGVCESEFRRRSPSLQAQVTRMPGSESSGKRRRLNPLFVEWLMGWPIGWSGSDSVEMESFRSWQRQHSTLLRAALES